MTPHLIRTDASKLWGFLDPRSVALVYLDPPFFIQDGVTTFEREFLADILLPNGETMHEAIRGRLAEAYDTGNMPLLLPPAGGAR